MKKHFAWIGFIGIVLILSGTVPVFAGGGQQKSQTVKLTAAINFNPQDEAFVALTEIARKYSAQNPQVAVEVVYYAEYEATMKTKMAANDLPDLWSTHGWSVARYSEYLEPLTGQLWASKVNPAIKSVISNSRGDIFVLPFDVDAAGVVFNRDVLDKAGVDPFSLKTWDDFKAACEKIKAAGFIPVDVAGGAADDWTVGNFFDWVAPSFLITGEQRNYRNALKDGSFDWENWRPVATLLRDFRDKGYLNPDYTQGSWDNVARRLGNGQLAFGFYPNSLITQAKQFGPNARYGFIPVPAASPSDTPTMITGERVTLGVWKDSPRKAEALKFLEYLSSPEVVSRIANISANQTGLIGPGYNTNAGELKEYFDRLAGIRGFPYFDREYLPNGMWDSMCKTGTGLLANTMTMDQVVARMRDDYNNLRQQQ
jgi:raffinose/stachyose/melibiose transport system substrate-binding protein